MGSLLLNSLGAAIVIRTNRPRAAASTIFFLRNKKFLVSGINPALLGQFKDLKLAKSET